MKCSLNLNFSGIQRACPHRAAFDWEMALQSGQRFCSHNDHENSFCCNLWGKTAGKCLNNLESSSCLACCDVYGWNSKSIDIRFARQCKASGQ